MKKKPTKERPEADKSNGFLNALSHELYKIEQHQKARLKILEDTFEELLKPK